MELTAPIPSPLVNMVISWVEGHRVLLRNAQVNQEESVYTYLEWLVQNEQHFMVPSSQQELEQNGNDNATGISSMESAAMKLNAVAIFWYLNNLEKALEFLNLLDNLENLKVPEANLEVVRLLRDSLKKSLELTIPPGVTSQVSLIESDLQAVGNEQLAAMLKFMEGYLGIVMGIPEPNALGLLREAIDKDPECHAWYHYAYRTQRRIRRNIDRSVNNRLDNPSDMEQDFARTCHQKGPGDFVAVGDLAMLLKENIWTQDEAFWNAHRGEYEESVRLFR